MKGICHRWSRGRHFSPSMPGDRYLKLRSQKRSPGRNLGEHRWVRRSGTASRGTALFVFRLRMRTFSRAEVLTIFEGNNNKCIFGYKNAIDAFACFTVCDVTVVLSENELAYVFLFLVFRLIGYFAATFRCFASFEKTKTLLPDASFYPPFPSHFPSSVFIFFSS